MRDDILLDTAVQDTGDVLSLPSYKKRALWLFFLYDGSNAHTNVPYDFLQCLYMLARAAVQVV